jgi:hypothetical protein
MTACHSMMFVSMGAPVTPEGGSVWSLRTDRKKSSKERKKGKQHGI